MDSVENSEKYAYTVATSLSPSRGDFVVTAAQNATQTIQAAVNAAAADPHIKRVVLGAGTFTLSNTVNIPTGITVVGSGFGTTVAGTGVFPAFTLNAAGNQTITGIRFSSFTFSLIGPASGVFAYGNWLSSAPINGNVTGSTTNNL